MRSPLPNAAILSLPDDLIQRVLAHGADLHSKDFIRACSCVNKRMCKLVSPWRSFYTTTITEVPPIPWECFLTPQRLRLCHAKCAGRSITKSISMLSEWANAGAFGGNLTSLNVSACGLSEEALKIMSDAFGGSKALMSLDVSWNDLKHKGAKYIADALRVSASLTQVLAFMIAHPMLLNHMAIAYSY